MYIAFLSFLALTAHTTRATVSSFIIHRASGINTSVDRSFTAGTVAPVSNAELFLELTVKGTLLDLSTGADVVNSSGSVVSGSHADITRRQGGADTQINISVTGLQGQAPGAYTVRIHYAIEANGPDVVRLRLLARGEVTSITTDPTPALLAGAYTPTNQTKTVRVTGTNLNVATFDNRISATIVSRSSTSMVLSVRMTQPGSDYVSSRDFYDENLGHAPTLSDENEMGVRYSGNASLRFFAVGAPSVTSISPQPSNGTGTLTLSGVNLTGSGLSLSRIRFGHRYSTATDELIRGTSSQGSFSATATSASTLAQYDIEAGQLELEFRPEAMFTSTAFTTPPPYTTTVPFSAVYPPTIDQVSASAEQSAISGVRILRAGSATLLGKYLLGVAAVSKTVAISTTVTQTGVRLGSLTLSVASTKYVPPTATTPGVDSVRVTLPDPSDNVAGQIRAETSAGSAVTPATFVLVTHPRVAALSELTDTALRVVSNQTVFRGRQYQISGNALSVKNGTQLLQTGSIRLNGRAVTMQPTTDPATQLKFLVPLDATTGSLIVSTVGGDTNLGTFVVNDAPAGSVPTPKPTSLTIAPTTLASGVSALGTVTIDNPGSSVAGFSVALSSSDVTAATVPATLAVSGTSATFTIATLTVNASRTVTITATSGGVSQTRTVTVTPPAETNVALSSNDVASGATVQGTVTFTGSATGTNVSLTSSDAAAPVVNSITANGNTATFSVATTEAPAPRTVTISATANGVTKSATVTVTPLRINSISSSIDTVHVGQTATITANMNRAAPTTLALTVATNQPSLVQFDNATLGVNSGQTSGTIGLRAIAAPSARTLVTITVSRSVVTAAFGTVTTTATRNVLVVP